MGTDLKNVPQWIRALYTLRRDVVVWPLEQFSVSRNGGYGAVRMKPGDGWCPPRPGERTPDSQAEEQLRAIARYPCTHYGADLAAPQMEKVYAPHDGWLLFLGDAGDQAPFTGYGPGVALLAHADTQDSIWERGWKYATGPLLDMFDFPEGQIAARYSLIGHVQPLASRSHELPGDIWDSTKTKPNPDHWRKLKDGTVAMMTDADAREPSRWVNAGDHIGYVSNARHIHWEIRTAPLAGVRGRLDPIAAWQQRYGMALPVGAKVARPASGGGAGAGVLLLLAALAFGKRKGTRAKNR